MAFKAGKRFIDQDLNRSFPGKKDGNHEQKLAFNIVKKLKRYDIVFDIHSTKSELKDALIVTKLNMHTKEIIKKINPKYLLHMKITGQKALISHARIGIAFEYGKEKDMRVVNKIVSDIYKAVQVGKREAKRTEYFEINSSYPKHN